MEHETDDCAPCEKCGNKDHAYWSGTVWPTINPPIYLCGKCYAGQGITSYLDWEKLSIELRGDGAPTISMDSTEWFQKFCQEGF